MAKEFNIKVLTPGSKVLDTKASEAVLPAFDGDVGVLADHQNYIGMLGTGVLKVVSGGDDYWYMVSSGVYEVCGGDVTVITEVAEEAKDVNPELAKNSIQELAPKLEKLSPLDENYPALKINLDRERARIEANRRTALH
jgi:F-type H+-transporting ATPase subunit epsilon